MKDQTGSRRIALPFFNLGAICGWAVNAAPRPLYCRESDRFSTVQEAGWTLGPVFMGRVDLALSRD
jgi:hypothetical protein